MSLIPYLLLVLTVHRGGSSILLHEAGSHVTYSTPLAILLAELLKILLSLLVLLRQELAKRKMEERIDLIQEDEKYSNDLSCAFSRQVYLRIMSGGGYRMLAPAALYIVQNNLFLYAAARIDPGIFQAIWQLRILSTAVLAQFILKRQILRIQWLALVLLVVGVLIVKQGIGLANGGLSSSSSSITATESISSISLLATQNLPILALLLSGLLGSLAGILLENALTKAVADLWALNIHLASYSILPGLFVLITKETSGSIDAGSFSAFYTSLWPTLVVVINGTSGLLVAAVTKHAGAIASNFSGAVAIVFTHLLSQILSEKATQNTFSVCMTMAGSFVIFGSSYMYSRASSMTTIIPRGVDGVIFEGEEEKVALLNTEESQHASIDTYSKELD